MKDTQPRIKKALFPNTASAILIHDNLSNFKKWQSSEFCDNGTEELRMFNKIREYPRASEHVRRAGDISQAWRWTAWLLENSRYSNKTKLVNSDPCLGTENTRSRESYLKNQCNMDSEIHRMYKGLPNSNLLKAPLKSNLVHKEITERKGRQINEKSNMNEKKTSFMIISPKLDNTKHGLCCYTFWDPCFRKYNSLVQITKEKKGNCLINSINATVEEHFCGTYLKNAVTRNERPKYYRYDLPIEHKLAAKILRNKVSMKSYNINIKRLMSNCSVQAADREKQLHRQSSFSTLKFLIGPYAQTHVVYNVMEQANAPMKEKGTSQQFKQRSQGIGSASISGNDSSSAPSKRRAIKIESNVSFSVQFIDRGKSSGTETSSPTSVTDTSVADTTKKKEKDKKELHRCLCTLSFPTDDKKLKKKPCDSGVCVPGKCTPSDCFKRLQEKYGSKKKSASDVSSSQASQTSKKKERAGKETVVKEKGSSSISKYKESTEVKPLPEKPKFDIVKTAKDCCNTYFKTYWDKLQFWKKDKPIELKPAVIGTDISVKDDKDKSFGSNAATQSGKIKGKAGKDVKGAPEDDKNATAKKGKKEKKEDKKRKQEEKKGEKKEDKKAEKKAGKKAEKKAEVKAEKKDQTKAEKKGVKKGKKKVEKKDEKKVEKKVKKKGEKKASRKKDKKAVEKEVKTETKAIGAKTQKGRPLKSYECEPGVCTPKVCSPQECYERKFPPPPPKVTATPYATIQNCLKKLCCRQPVVETGGVSAATQARKSTVPEVTPGTTVYKDTGSSPKQRAGKKGEKQGIAAGVQPPAEGGGDVKSKRQTAFSGIQFFQTTDSDTMVHRQGVNIGSECSCSVEFYKMKY